MHYTQIIEKCLNALAKKFPNDELRSPLTHWLQSPDILPPCFTSEHRQCAILSILSHLADKKTDSTSLEVKASQPFQLMLSLNWENLPYPPTKIWDFTFIDLFAGIGGFRQAFQEAKGKCIFSSEWDAAAQKTYEANYGEIPYGDIRKIRKNDIPDHDVLCAGFPCQPFSLAGVSKKNSLGRKHGFEDKTQGTLFFEIKEILAVKRPAAFMLENVKNLLRHDQGKTFEVIRHTLEDVLGYVINWKIVDGANWVPQHRERIFIVGYNPDLITIKKDEIIIPEKPSREENYIPRELKDIVLPTVDGYTLGAGTWDTLKRHKAHHEAEGNGFGYGLHKVPIKPGEITRTIYARYHKDGAEILIEQPGQRPRRLTVEEAMQLQGYQPGKFIFPVSKTQAYKQIGNSVVWPAVRSCAFEIAKILQTRRKLNESY